MKDEDAGNEQEEKIGSNLDSERARGLGRGGVKTGCRAQGGTGRGMGGKGRCMAGRGGGGGGRGRGRGR